MHYNSCITCISIHYNLSLSQATGLNMAMNSSTCPAPMQTYSWGIVSSGVYLLQHDLSDSHHLLGLYLLCHGFNHGPQTLWRQTCCSVDLSISTDALRCSGMACPWPQVLESVPASTWTLNFGPQSLQERTCYSVDMSLATDALRCACSHM